MSPRVVCAVAAAALVAGGLAVWFRAPGSASRSAKPLGLAVSSNAVAAPALEEPVQATRRTAGDDPGADDSSAHEPVESPYSGVVRSRDGKPIEGAIVALYPPVEAWRELRPLASVTIGENGSFGLNLPGVREARLVASAPGFLERSFDSVRPGKPLYVVLLGLVELQGRVLDRDTQGPVAGATVTCLGQTVETDSGGNYRFAELYAETPLRVEARREGFAPAWVATQLRPGSATLDVWLERGTEVRMTVVDESTGQPLAGAEVRESRRSEPFAVTGRDGVFALRVAEGYELSLYVDADGYAPFSWSWDVPDLERLDGVRIPMLGLAWIDGIVVDAAGVPQEKVAIWVESDGRSFGGVELDPERKAQLNLLGYVDYGQKLRVETDEHGHFSAGVVPNGTECYVEVRSEERARTRVGPLMLTRPGERRALNIVLGEGATLRGRLIRNGEPVSGGSLSWAHVEGPTGWGSSDGEGAFELNGLPVGEVTVQARFEGIRVTEPVTLTVEAGQVYVRNFEWKEEYASITGRVTTEAGGPLEGIEINAYCDAGEQGSYWYDARTAVDGSYAIEVSPGRRYQVSASTGVENRWREEVDPGTNGVDFSFAELGSLVLLLLDADRGEPVPLAEPSPWGLCWRVSGQGDYRRVKASYDHGGRIELELPIGRVDLSIFLSAQGYAPEHLDGVRVDRSPSAAPVVVELTRGAQARIRIVGDRLERELLESHVFFFLERSQRDLVRGPFPEPSGGSNWSFGSFSSGGVDLWLADFGLMNQMPALDGSSLLRGLAPGTYSLRALPDDLVFEPGEVEVVGPRTEVELRWSRR